MSVRTSSISRASAILILALVFAGVANAASGAGWTARSMARALKGLGYPKPHPKTLSCLATVGATHDIFTCTATYGSQRKMFYASGDYGGFVCVGRYPESCTTLKHGFIRSKTGVSAAAKGWMALHDGDPQPPRARGTCAQSSKPLTWSFCYKLKSGGNVDVSVTIKRTVGGYITSVSGKKY
jgi:hypothetical protein